MYAVTYLPFPFEYAHCNDCNWKGNPDELLSDSWEHYRYCPVCESDDIKLINKENIYGEKCDM